MINCKVISKYGVWQGYLAFFHWSGVNTILCSLQSTDEK